MGGIGLTGGGYSLLYSEVTERPALPQMQKIRISNGVLTPGNIKNSEYSENTMFPRLFSRDFLCSFYADV